MFKIKLLNILCLGWRPYFIMCERKKSIEQYKSLINVFADPCDDTIYHYTSSEGIRGIIGKSELWLSNAIFFNYTAESNALQQ